MAALPDAHNTKQTMHMQGGSACVRELLPNKAVERIVEVFFVSAFFFQVSEARVDNAASRAISERAHATRCKNGSAQM
jgi:hypothetical protein